jgi:hypothetical protein
MSTAETLRALYADLATVGAWYTRRRASAQARTYAALPELAGFVEAAVAYRNEATWQTRPAFDDALAALDAKLTPSVTP